MRTTYVVAAAASGIPSGDERPIANHRRWGVWQRQESGQLICFGSDGSYAIDDGGLLGLEPDDTGMYQVDHDSITLISAGSAACAAGAVQLWAGARLGSVAHLPDGEAPVFLLHTDASDPDCPIYSSGAQTWLHLSP